MAKKGEAGKALGTGVVFSFLGGLFSFLVLMFVAPSVGADYPEVFRLSSTSACASLPSL